MCQVFEMNAGYKREFSLTDRQGETFEEELTWGVDSKILVTKGHVAEASLVVDERKQTGDFQVTTKIRGFVYITFTAPRDNNSLVKATGTEIATVVEKYLDTERRKGNRVEHIRVIDDQGERVVVIETKGRCKFRYGVKQDIQVDQKPINNVKSRDTSH